MTAVQSTTMAVCTVHYVASLQRGCQGDAIAMLNKGAPDDISSDRGG